MQEGTVIYALRMCGSKLIMNNIDNARKTVWIKIFNIKAGR